MNAICGFRLCTLSNVDLMQKVDELTDSIYEGKEIPARHIPARPDKDYDLLIGELILRFKDLTQPTNAFQCEHDLIEGPHGYKCSKCNASL